MAGKLQRPNGSRPTTSMNHPLCCMLLPVLIASAAAQNATLQSVIVSQAALSAVSEVVTSTQNVPIGQQLTAPNGGIYASALGLADASLGWSGPTQLQNGAIEYRYSAMAHVLPPPSGAIRRASVAEHEVLISLQAAGVRSARVIAEITGVATAGQLAPRLDVDLYADGVIDGDTLQGFNRQVLLSTIAVPLRITIGCGVVAGAGQEALAVADLRLRVLPVNDVDVFRTSLGCASPLEFRVNAAFDHAGVRLGLPEAQNVHVVVLGLVEQPTFVTTLGGSPCLLWPRPDVVVLGQPGGIDLPIPAAVRPFAFHAQAIGLSAFVPLLMFTDSFAVLAH
jgi:hypothetical protein